jgi:WG containing repeat
VHKAHTYKTTTVAVGLIPLLLFLTTSCQQTQALNKNKTASSKVAIKLERVIPPVKIPSGKENIRYGFIDRSGQFVIEPKFLGASCFKGGLASVITDKGYAYIDKSGRFVTPPGEYIAYHGGNCDDTWPNYAEGLYRVKQIFRVSGTKDDDTKSFAGYVNAQGKLVISLAPYYADDFSDGMARITVYADTSQEKQKEGERRGDSTRQEKHGYIDTTGKIVISPQFDRAKDFRAGIASVGIKRLEVDPIRPGTKKAVLYYGIIDKKGRYLVEPSRGLTGITNIDGCVGSASDELIKNSKLLMGKDALTKDSVAFKELCSSYGSDELRDGFATRDIPMPPSTTEMDYVLINQAGKQLFPGITSNSPIRYQRVRDGINEGLALIKNDDVNGLKCYIDNQGNFVIPCKFKEAEVFREGLAAVAIEIDPKKK